MSLRLREIRLLRNMTQQQVADALGCSSVVYSRYETGAREPSIDMLINMANYFDVSVDYLVGREPVENTALSDYEKSLVAVSRKSTSQTKEDILDFLTMKANKGIQV